MVWDQLLFTAGANLWDVAASLLVVGAGAYTFALTVRKPRAERDSLYLALTAVTVAGFMAVYAYIGIVSGGQS